MLIFTQIWQRVSMIYSAMINIGVVFWHYVHSLMIMIGYLVKININIAFINIY